MDELLAETVNYNRAPFEETTDGTATFSLEMPADDEDAAFIVGGHQLVFKDLEANFRLFTIREPEDDDGPDGAIKRAICLSSLDELNDEMVEDIRPQNRTARYTLERVLEGTRFQAGTVADLGLQSTNFYYISTRETLNKIRQVWGGEYVDRVEIDESGITGRFIDLLYRRGKDTGKRWEMDKDIESIHRKIKHYPKTALYGKGKSLETDNGGYTRKITFADVEWSVENGNPVDKPLGQEWVGDPGALEKHGTYIPDTGDRQHRKGLFEDGDEENPEVLLMKTWQALQERKETQAEFNMSVTTFEGIAGQEHELARFGDTGTAINKDIHPPIIIEARVTKFKYDIGDPTDGEITLGNYSDLFEREKAIEEVIQKVNDRAGVWDRAENKVTDEDFPDDVPDPPENVQAEGLFQTVMLNWEYNSSSYIAAYEVYASQVQGFEPDSTNLIFRGKVGMFLHKVAVNQQWYYKVRAVNTHGTPGAFSEEESAVTVRIQGIDMAMGSVNAAILDDLAVTAAKLSLQAVQAQHIANQAVGNQAIENQAVTNQKIANQAVGYAQIAKAAITDELIASNAEIDFAKIANVVIGEAEIEDASVTYQKIKGKLLANQIVVGNDTQFDDGFDPSEKADIEEVLNTATNTAFNMFPDPTFQLGEQEWNCVDANFEFVDFRSDGSVNIKGSSASNQDPDFAPKGTGNIWLNRNVEHWASIEFRNKKELGTRPGELYFSGGAVSTQRKLLTYNEVPLENNWVRYIYRIPANLLDGSDPLCYISWRFGDWNNPDTFDLSARKPMLHEGNAPVPFNTGNLEIAYKLWALENSVYMDGGKIAADTILANAIKAGAITARHIAANSITGNMIKSNADIRVTEDLFIGNKLFLGYGGSDGNQIELSAGALITGYESAYGGEPQIDISAGGIDFLGTDLFSTAPITNVPCNIAGVTAGRPSNTPVVSQYVYFTLPRPSAPSSVDFSHVAKNANPKYSFLTEYGFSFYVEAEGNNYSYFSGYYSV
ncbi:hypothetical protein E4663_06735 [Halobacillus salinus]|uniref:Tail spike domain-containing protein n=2 Tax=Halobacillus salinus TaxID=192814 RepID=A0A4Z0H5H2_9BACI|nr:hypothetical protein E4663_06735 [Halobacillus salinus]